VEISDLVYERKVSLRKWALKILHQPMRFKVHLEFNPPFYFHDWLLIKSK